MGKLATFVMSVLVVGLAFAMISSIVSDFENQYPDTEVDSNWSEYDKSEQINNSVYGLKKDFDTIGDESEGWFTKLGAGISAIPQAVIAVPSVIFTTFSNGVNIMSDAAKEIGIPSFVIPFAIIALIVGVIFAIISYWRRYEA